MLSLREEEQLKRLLSDPTKYPQTLKTWIISWLEGSDLSLPMSSVVGLSDRLAQATAGGVLAGTVATNTDAAGHVRVDFAALVGAIHAVTVTGIGGPPVPPTAPATTVVCTFNLTAVDLSGFQVLVWNVPANVAFASQPVGFAWLASVTP